MFIPSMCCISLIQLLLSHFPECQTIVTAARQNNFEIRVGDSPISSQNPPVNSGNALCASYMNSPQTDRTHAVCTNGYGIHGRYVSIQLIGISEYLSLCEVQVFGPAPGVGVPPAPPPTPSPPQSPLPPRPPPPTGQLQCHHGMPVYRDSRFLRSDWTVNSTMMARYRRAVIH